LKNLAEKINSKEGMGSVIQETENLTNKIEAFFKTDPYMSQAIHENSVFLMRIGMKMPVAPESNALIT